MREHSVVSTKQPLTDRQLAVLQWVAEDSPSGGWADGDYTYKTTCYGLANRRLVTVDRRRHHWKATITVAGRFYLKHGTYPFEDSKLSRTKADKPTTSTDAAAPVTRPTRPKTQSAAGKHKSAYKAKSDQLVEDVVAAGGRLVVTSDGKGPNYDHLVQLAIRRGVVPEGKLLKIVRGRGWGERIISLDDPPEWMTIELAPIPIAEQLRKPHAAVKRLRDDSEQVRLPRSARGRALRMLNALALTASKRGHEVRTTERPKSYVHHRERDDSSLTVVIKGHDFGVEVTEVYKRVPHVPTDQELRRVERDSWYRIPKNDDVPTGILKFSVNRGFPHRQSSWTDSDENRSARMLAEILQEIELRAHAAEKMRLKREREAQERRARWQRAMDQANEGLQETHRASILRSQLEA